jgi:hypothetical protein
MKKRYIISAVGASMLGAGAAGYFLMNDQQKSKIKDTMKQFTGKNDSGTTFERAGYPDQLDERDYADLENAKMVSEGSQFGVQYYNERQEELPVQ